MLAVLLVNIPLPTLRDCLCFKALEKVCSKPQKDPKPKPAAARTVKPATMCTEAHNDRSAARTLTLRNKVKEERPTPFPALAPHKPARCARAFPLQPLVAAATCG